MNEKYKKRKRKESHWHDGQPSGYDWISRSTRLAIYARDSNECLACGNTDSLTLDHLRRDLPKSDVHKPSNLVTLCLTCNSSRRNTASEVWDPKFHEIAYFKCVSRSIARLGFSSRKRNGRSDTQRRKRATSGDRS